MVEFEYIVIGAGLAGSTIAERVASKLGKKVLIIERRNHIGGNCYDYVSSEGIIVHKYGPHLFHTSYTEVFNYLSNFTDWNVYQHKVLAFVDGKKIPLPFNLDGLYILFPETLAKRLEKKLLRTYSYNQKVPIMELKNNSDEDIRFLGEYIYKKIYLNYTIKQWDSRPEDMGLEVISRVPIRIGKDDRYFDDKYQAVPQSGYTKIFERMLSHPNIYLMLNTDFKDVMKMDLETHKIYFLGAEFKGKVIYTGMIDELFDYRLGYLPYRSLKMIFKTLNMEYFQEKATVNYPNDYDFTRITEFKHIHPKDTNKTVILMEYPKVYKVGKDIPFYPILKKDNLEIFYKYYEMAERFENLFVVGRLAEYKYYDMDDVVKKALEVFEILES